MRRAGFPFFWQVGVVGFRNAEKMAANPQLDEWVIHEARTEPWTQITARLLSPEGLLVAVCYTPSFHGTSDPAP
jgi:hypothetical protein